MNELFDHLFLNKKKCMKNVIIETKRLLLREWMSEDVGSLHKIMSDPDVMRYVWDYEPASVIKVEDFILNCMDEIRDRYWSTWPVLMKETGVLIGYCGFLVRSYGEYQGETEMGWLLGKQYWGQGFATEAAKAVLGFGLEQWSFKKVIAAARSENKQSLEVMKKIGMKELRPSLNPKGCLIPHYGIDNVGP